MSRVGQISIARPGFPLQLKFEVSDLKLALEQDAQSGDHVTLYPGDYTNWYTEDDNYNQNTEIEIKEGVSVTILPGAKTQYYSSDQDNFRHEEFRHNGEVFDSKDEDGNLNHPLSTTPNPDAKRYEVPNFTGHIENIADMNLGSEWAFESDVENLRDEVNNIESQSNKFKVTVGSQNEDPEVILGNSIEFRETENVSVTTEQIEEGSVGVDIEFIRNDITQVDAGDYLNSQYDNGEVTINHEQFVTTGSNENSGSTFIQSLFFTGGHVKNIETGEVAVFEDREPRSYEGENGDIWFVDERESILDLYFSPQTPSEFKGKEGDLWFKSGSLDKQFWKAGRFFFSNFPSEPNEGENGDVWIQVDSWNGPGDFNVRDIDEVVYTEKTPTSSVGEEGEIYGTTVVKS